MIPLPTRYLFSNCLGGCPGIVYKGYWHINNSIMSGSHFANSYHSFVRDSTNVLESLIDSAEIRWGTDG